MSNIYQKIAVVTIGAFFSFNVIENKPVQAATFSFFFPEGYIACPDCGNVSGIFNALDEDFNDVITKNEVTEFKAVYTGTNFSPGAVPVIPAFTHTLEDLVSFNFNLNDFMNFEFLSFSATDKTIILQTSSPEGNELISGRGVGVGLRGVGSVGTSGFFTVVELEEPLSVPESSPIIALGFVGLVGLVKKMIDSKS